MPKPVSGSGVRQDVEGRGELTREERWDRVLERFERCAETFPSSDCQDVEGKRRWKIWGAHSAYDSNPELCVAGPSLPLADSVEVMLTADHEVELGVVVAGRDRLRKALEDVCYSEWTTERIDAQAKGREVLGGEG